MILKSIVAYALDWILRQLTQLYSVMARDKAAQAEIDAKTKAEAEAVKQSQTEDELEKAAKEILSRH